MQITTKTGDEGFTSLIGGERVSKADLRVEAYGTIDELSACIGCCLASGVPNSFKEELENIQKDLFYASADLADKRPQAENYLKEERLAYLEKILESRISKLPRQMRFILPGGGMTGSLMHSARTVCRRAERACVRITAESAGEHINKTVLIYLNRLSDYLYAAARLINIEEDRQEKEV